MEALNTQLLRFFDWLLWTTIQGSVLIVLIVLLQLILRRRLPVRCHYILWVLLLVRLAIPWLPESKMSVFNLVPQSIQHRRIIESIATNFIDDIGCCSSSESTSVQNAESPSFLLSQERESVTADNNIALLKTDIVQQTVSEPTQVVGSATSDTPLANLKEVFKAITYKFLYTLPLIWLIGVVVMIGCVSIRNIYLWLIIRREGAITDQKVIDLLEGCKMQTGIETIINVVESDRVKSPALFGFVRPRLLLPQGMLETFGHDELRYIFIHELAHLKQRDIYFGWLMAFLQIVHWFNPLMWIAFNRVRADRELACDRLAISVMEPDELPEYGRTIVRLLESFSQVRYLPSMVGILEDTSQIERRIKMIVDFKKTSRIQSAGAMLLVAVLACVVLTNAHQVKADYAFGTPFMPNLGAPNDSSQGDGNPDVSTDGLVLFFNSYRPGGYGSSDIWVTTRATSDLWEAPLNIGPPVNSPAYEGSPSISVDGLCLYFTSDRSGGAGNRDLWVSTRATTNDSWGEPVNLGLHVNSMSDDGDPEISADNLVIFFNSNRSGGYGENDLYMTMRATTSDPWSAPVNLGPTVNSSGYDGDPEISIDGLQLFFSSYRGGGHGLVDLWMTTRSTSSDPWESPVNLGPIVNSSMTDSDPTISTDGSTLYFSRRQSGAITHYDLWQVTIEPVVDFNVDGNIDTDDLLILIDYWGTNESLCDIGPTPLGDGIVDMKDLEVFMSHWEQENMPPVPADDP